MSPLAVCLALLAVLVGVEVGPLKTETTNSFSIIGEVNPEYPRSFFINRNYGGCPADNGWLVVVEDDNVCEWETRDPRVPHILYSKKSTHVNYMAGGHDVGTADVMVVSIKTCGHVTESGDEHPLHHHDHHEDEAASIDA
ncbi:uncharacterized protein [Branchiostoma lanceolatum]|uniref:uncharacterized protein n=1 Tax=Branchiostoma lanceolatum TaxID=7740 RepID=UPI00345159BB